MRPVDVRRVHDPESRISRIYSIDSPQHLGADKLIVAVKFHNDIINLAVVGNGMVPIVQRIPSKLISHYYSFAAELFHLVSGQVAGYGRESGI
jgi:hypothetical protein